MMLRFRKALNHLEVKEIPLRGRKYTWSNNQNLLTMTKIDRAFMDVVNEAWNKEVPQHLNHLVVLHVKLSRTAKMLRA
jgi:hypothetical protein